jgi:hypothetical protein
MNGADEKYIHESINLYICHKIILKCILMDESVRRNAII